jgi:hypothetical protein
MKLGEAPWMSGLPGRRRETVMDMETLAEEAA